MGKYLTPAKSEKAQHLSRNINDTSNDSGTKENNFYLYVVIAERLICDNRILRYGTERKVNVIYTSEAWRIKY